MQVNLFVLTKNNELELEGFVNFYKSRVPEIIINIFDWDSEDKTVEKAKQLGCKVKIFWEYYNSIDIWKNECWKFIPTDCVVICEIDEFIDLQPNIFKNCSLVKTKGYDIESLDKLTEEKRNDQYDKFCIFDPHVIKNMHYEGNSCNPQGFIKVGEIQPILYHLIKQ